VSSQRAVPGPAQRGQHGLIGSAGSWCHCPCEGEGGDERTGEMGRGETKDGGAHEGENGVQAEKPDLREGKNGMERKKKGEKDWK